MDTRFKQPIYWRFIVVCIGAFMHSLSSGNVERIYQTIKEHSIVDMLIFRSMIRRLQ